jgi:hypothetical protein
MIDRFSSIINIGSKLKPETQITQEKKDKQEYKYVGKVHIKSGCKLWAYNPKEDKMNEVTIAALGTIDFFGNVIEGGKAQFNPNFIYFQAINKKNALRKLNQYKNGKHEVAETFEPKEFEKLLRW